MDGQTVVGATGRLLATRGVGALGLGDVAYPVDLGSSIYSGYAGLMG